MEVPTQVNARTALPPASFFSEADLECIDCIVQFGSTLYDQDPADIDLCVVTRPGMFYEFVDSDVNKRIPACVDISLLRCEEVSPKQHFRFGSHGVHLLVPLKSGRCLYGKNPFVEYPMPSAGEVRRSILDRLYDYQYEVRKLETSAMNHSAAMGKRWQKFLRLALYLLGNELDPNYTKALELSDDEVHHQFLERDLEVSAAFNILSFEQVWERVIANNLNAYD